MKLHRMLFWLTPAKVKHYYERRIAALEHRLETVTMAIENMRRDAGFVVYARDQRELLSLTKRQMALRRVQQDRANNISPRGFRLPFVARIFRRLSQFLSRVAKRLDAKPAGAVKTAHQKPQLQLDLKN